MKDDDKLRDWVLTGYDTPVSKSTVISFVGLMLLSLLCIALLGGGIAITVISALIVAGYCLLCLCIHKKHGMKNGYNFLVTGLGGCLTSVMFLIAAIVINYDVTGDFNNAVIMVVFYILAIFIFYFLTLLIIKRFNKTNKNNAALPVTTTIAGAAAVSARHIVKNLDENLAGIIVSVVLYLASVAFLFSLAVLIKYFILKFSDINGGIK